MTEVLAGKGVVPGTAVGKVMVLSNDLSAELETYCKGTAIEETKKLKNAFDKAYGQVKDIIDSAKKSQDNERAEIMEAHLLMLSDPELLASMEDKIKSGFPAPDAVLTACEAYAAIFDVMDDDYLKERAADVRDIGRRVAKILLDIADTVFSETEIIICADQIEPSLIANIPLDKVKGLILGQGSTTSHAVIIAKARGLVCVVGLSDNLKKLVEGELVVVDGHTGNIIIGPALETKAKYEKIIDDELKQRENDYITAQFPATTTDGVRVQLAANIGLPEDIDSAIKFGAEGVGLYRTEFLFMGRDTIPSEEEQFKAYKAVIEKCGKNLCVIRTMDIGGDKPLPHLGIGQEQNPFLGARAIRISLVRPDLFVVQLKAILRAAVFGNAAIMFPMIINVSELHQAKEFLNEAKRLLKEENKNYKEVPIGIMVETPAACVIADILAKECDFFSIGTNDLVQYTLAVDRGNPKVSALYNHLHPAVLRLINNVIEAGRTEKIWVGMCGEMASDPDAAVLLLAMGISELSMNGPSIPRVKERVRSITFECAGDILKKVLTLTDGDEVRKYLSKVFEY